MIGNINNIFIFLLLISLGVSYNVERSEVKEYDQSLMYDLLKSLLTLNEARYDTLRKLNYLNNINYLRSSPDNGYDFIYLLNKLKSIFQLLSVKPNLDINNDDQNYYDVYYDDIYILTIPIHSKINNFLRTRSVETVSDENNDKIIHDTDVKSISDENNDVVYKNKGLRYYECGRGFLRCYNACREACLVSCATQWCKYSFINEMRESCRYACEDRFD